MIQGGDNGKIPLQGQCWVNGGGDMENTAEFRTLAHSQKGVLAAATHESHKGQRCLPVLSC